MISSVNKVFVGKKVATATTIDTMAIGDIFLYDVKTGAINTPTEGNPFKIGKVIGDMNVTLSDGTVQVSKQTIFGNEINPFKVKSTADRITGTTDNNGALIADFVRPFLAPVEQVSTLDLTNTTITVGYRYVLRIYYRDIYELKSMFTKSYEYFATSADTATTVVAALAATVNKDLDRRVNVTVAGPVMTLTALPKNDNEGVDAINLYSQVNFTAMVYATDEFRWVGNRYIDTGAVYELVTAGSPGSGYWKVVRDREKLAMPYRGVTNQTWFPIIKPAMTVDPTVNYDTIVLEYENSFASADNQYRKNVWLAEEIYLPTGTADTLGANIKTYLGIA